MRLVDDGLPAPTFWSFVLGHDNFTFSCVKVDGELSPWFETSSGVRLGCVVAAELFLEPMDWITNRAAHKGFLGVTVGEEICTDLDYADDVSLFSILTNNPL